MGRRQNDSAHPPEVRPLDVDGVRTVAIVTVGWGVAFVALALRQGQLNDAGNGWWLWTCLAGVGLGLLGLEYCRKRRDAIAQAALEAEAEVGESDDDSAVGDWSRLPPEQELDAAAEEQPQPDEQPAPASGDHITQPYEPSEPAPGYTTGDMPAVPGRIGSPDHGYGPQSYPAQAEPHTPQPSPREHEPEPQPPAEWPQPQQAPQAPAPQQQPSMPAGAAHPRRVAQHPGQPQPDQAPAQHTPPPPSSPPQAPPARQAPPPPPPGPPHAPPPQQPHQPAAPPVQQPSQPPPSPPQAPPPAQPPVQPPQQPEPEPADPYSTGAGWYDSAAGYTPDADRARRHPRDRRPETAQPSGPAAESPPAGQERSARRSLEDSEFFGDDSAAPPPNSTAEFLLADLQGDDEPPPPAHHDRDAPGDEYRGRRARGSR